MERFGSDSCSSSPLRSKQEGRSVSFLFLDFLLLVWWDFLIQTTKLEHLNWTQRQITLSWGSAGSCIWPRMFTMKSGKISTELNKEEKKSHPAGGFSLKTTSLHFKPNRCWFSWRMTPPNTKSRGPSTKSSFNRGLLATSWRPKIASEFLTCEHVQMFIN